MDIRGKILDKYGQSTANTVPNSAEIFSIHGGAYLQIIGDRAEKRPRPVKEPQKPLKSWERPRSIQRKYFRAAVKVASYSVSLRPIIVDIRERHTG